MPRIGGSNHSTKRLTIEDMHETARKMGGKCLSVEYIKNDLPLNWQCVAGHIWSAVPSSARSGHWCPICTKYRAEGLSEFQRIAAKRGGRCLTTEYKNMRTEMVFQCARGHTWSAMPFAVKHGTWCQKCHLEKIHKKG